MKKCILLIDDDPDELDIFSDALEKIKKPLVCIQARGARAAKSLLNYLLPDYIFLDVNMPEINGLEFLEEIKEINALKEVPVILYSNFIDETVVNKALVAGAAACVKKPRKVSTMAKMLDGIFSMDVESPPA